MAMASSAKASSDQTVNVIWCAATSASPSRAATAVAITSMARSDSVRTSSGAPARPLARIPATSGRSDAPCRRAPRTTTTR